MNNFKFIKLAKNSKSPIKNQNFKDVKPLHEIDINKYNIGLMAGCNNLIILDVDIKDGGLSEWTEYKKINFEPYTMKQQTPSGGYHYIFLHNDPRYTPEQIELINRLKNKSKYRGFGLDIRVNNGYVVYSPSIIDDKPYKLINDIKPDLMPISLIKWLLEYEKHNEEIINNNLVILRSKNDIKTITTILNYKYFNNVSSSMWFLITTSLKNLLHKYNNIDEITIINIWDEWSKNQPNYNRRNNKKIWNSIKGGVNFNYIITQHNENNPDEKIKLVDSFKPMIELTTEIKTIEMNNKFIYDDNYNKKQFNYKTFVKYDTIIIKSTTGTGKTSNVSKHIKKYIEDKPELKILSLIDRICLSYQHLDSFKKAGINMVSYQDDKKNIEDDNIIICLNSLLMYSKYTKEFFNNYIVYIDEITSFLFSLTHNDNLNSVLKMVYIVLMKIINNCHKVIVSDATITDSTFNFLSKRHQTKTVFINNSFRKYEGVKAYKINDENQFLNLLKKHAAEKKYYLFGCDSKTIVDKFYEELETEDKEKFTCENRRKIKDASIEFKNKFIIYSPTITTGIDFTTDEPQNVFLYIKGSSITPEASFQQLSRTRNIKKVFFYINETASKNANYSSIEQTKEHYKNVCSTHKLFNMCCSISDEEDGIIFNENSFFNIFIYNEYIIDIFNTNKKQHFINILDDNKFKIKEIGTLNKLSKKKNKELSDNLKINKTVNFIKSLSTLQILNKIGDGFIDDDEEFKGIEFIAEGEEAPATIPEQDEEDDEDKGGINPQTVLLERMKFLNITDSDKAFEFKDIIMDEYKLSDYLNFLRILKDETYIKAKLIKETNALTQYKAVYTNYYKISLLSQLEKEMNIERFNVQKLKDDKQFKLSDELNKKINSSYRCSEFPITFNECITYYINKLKHLTGFINIVNCERKQINGKRDRYYNINKNEIIKYLNLYNMSLLDMKNIIKCSLMDEILKPKVTINLDEVKKIDETTNELKQIDIIELFEFPDKKGLDFGI